VFQEPAIGLEKVLTSSTSGSKVGYLLYNSFISHSEEDLNQSFSNFIAEGIEDLIIDLRYNGGGSVATCVAFGQMITGQFSDQVYVKENWNSDFQAYLEEEFPLSLITNFTDVTRNETPINSLGLTKLYVLTSERTASASEMLINSLSAYIDVVHIGATNGTVGKSEASVTFYDSDNLYSKTGIATNHSFAIQPLIYRSVNANDEVVPSTGLIPDIIAEESITNMGILGDPNEQLLYTALSEISSFNTTSTENIAAKKKNIIRETIGSNKENNPIFQKMYLDDFESNF